MEYVQFFILHKSEIVGRIEIQEDMIENVNVNDVPIISPEMELKKEASDEKVAEIRGWQIHSHSRLQPYKEPDEPNFEPESSEFRGGGGAEV